MARRKIKYDFNPLKGIRLPENRRERALAEIKDFVWSQILGKTLEGNSPVSGARRYRPLTKKYADNQKGGNRTPNLRLSGELMQSVSVVDAPGRGIRATVSSDQQRKADGHNNFTGLSKLPRRAFIPDAERGEIWKRNIESGIRTIVKRFQDENGN